MVCLSNQLIEASNLIPTMFKEYSLDSSLYKEQVQDEDAPKNSNYILQSFSLDQYKTKNKNNNAKLNENENMNENWLLLIVTDYFFFCVSLTTMVNVNKMNNEGKIQAARLCQVK